MLAHLKITLYITALDFSILAILQLLIGPRIITAQGNSQPLTSTALEKKATLIAQDSYF